MVESAGTAPAATNLQGSNAPLCTPRDGVQSQCRPDLLGASSRCFHWISFLDGELRRARGLRKMARTSGIEPLSMRGQRMALPIYQVRKFRRMVGNRGIEPRMRKGAGFTGPLSYQTWRYPKSLESLP